MYMKFTTTEGDKMSAIQTAIAMTRRDGLPLATVTRPDYDDVTLCNYDALHFAKTLIRNGVASVTLITERGRFMNSDEILASKF